MKKPFTLVHIHGLTHANHTMAAPRWLCEVLLFYKMYRMVNVVLLHVGHRNTWRELLIGTTAYIWCICLVPTNFIYLPLKTPLLYTYVCQPQVMSNLAIKTANGSLAPTDHDGQFPPIWWRSAHRHTFRDRESSLYHLHYLAIRQTHPTVIINGLTWSDRGNTAKNRFPRSRLTAVNSICAVISWRILFTSGTDGDVGGPGTRG